MQTAIMLVATIIHYRLILVEKVLVMGKALTTTFIVNLPMVIHQIVMILWKGNCKNRCG